MPFLLSLFSTAHCVSCVRAFFIVQNEFCLALPYPEGILVNGGLIILPHVWDDLGSVQSGHAGELLAEDSDT